MRIIKAPQPIKYKVGEELIFLAGSIEMGAAENWQQAVEKRLVACDHLVLLNPRRDDWDSSWEQAITNPQFREQVEWELDALEKAHIILMYFDPNTKSPISLLELGLFARTGKLILCCPKGYWRKGNVDIVCEKYAVEQVDSLQGLISAVGKSR